MTNQIDRDILQCAAWCHGIFLPAQLILIPATIFLTSVAISAIPQTHGFSHDRGFSLAFLGIFLWPLVDACLSIILVIAFWQVNLHRHSFIKESGKEAVNFLLSVILYLFIVDTITLANCGFPGFDKPGSGSELALLAITFNLFLILFTLVKLINASGKISKGTMYRYPYIIRFLR